MQYEYSIYTQGKSSWSFLEGFGAQLNELLNSAAVTNQVAQGWELWQVQTLNDKQGNNGFILIFRRPH